MKKHSRPPVGTNPCFTPIPTQSEVEAQFRKKIKAPKDGANAPKIEKFLTTMGRVRATLKSFTIDDVAYVGRAHEMSYQEIEELLRHYIDVNVRCGRVEEIANGVYDQTTYIWLV